jgi:predicted phosphodiesterase
LASNKEIIEFLSKNPEHLGKHTEVAALFSTSVDRVRGIARRHFLDKPDASLHILPNPLKTGDPNNVLVIADTHIPFCRPGYLEFCRLIQEQYNCGTVIHIGDEVDNCALSAWEKDPDGLSANSEYRKALKEMAKWYKVFPEVKVCIGNHSERMFRMARTAGLPKRFLRGYEDIWEAPEGWKWANHWEVGNVMYTHGTGSSGSNAAIARATFARQNTVIGHIHTEAGVRYSASSKDLVWGMMLGGAIDDKAYAFAYARDHIKKSIVGVGVVLNNSIPLYIPMTI